MQIDPSVLDSIAQFFLTTFGPKFLAVLLLIGTFRSVFKPFCALLQAVAVATPTKKDDELIGKAASNKWYKAIAWLVDYLTSIKLPK
jgi:hypothetical protein